MTRNREQISYVTPPLMKMITLTWSPGHYLGAPHVAAPQGDDVAHDPGNIGGHDASKYG